MLQITNTLLAAIITALIKVEGVPINPKEKALAPALVTAWQVGKDGERGALQISAGVVDDVNRIYKIHLRHEDVDNLPTAKIVCGLYLQHYVPLHVEGKRPGPPTIVRSAAIIWHEGPHMVRTPRDLDYSNRVWNLVKASLEQEKKQP